MLEGIPMYKMHFPGTQPSWCLSPWERQ